MRIAYAVTVMCGALALPLGAEDLPSFAACMDAEAARFERRLPGLRAEPEGDQEAGDVRGVGYCGSVGIVLCDRSRAPYACQIGLRLEQDVLTAKVLSSLPDPDEITGEGWAAAFYPRLWAIAQGSSAGPDCAGDLQPRRVWCETWEANNRLSNAVLAWQAARYLGAADSAVVAGWANGLRPTRPRARSDG
jgi:hypothetical protein